MLRTEAPMSRRLRSLALLVLGASLAASSGGCDLTRFTANSTAAIFGRASAGLEQQFDYELVGDGLPASILQLEGVFRIVPDNEQLGLNLVRAYVSYGYGWIEDDMEEA